MSAPLCVGHMLSCRMFSLFNGLPSPLSVTSLSSLFEWFISTMPLSDSSATRGEPCGLGLLSPSYRPFGSADVAEVSRFSCMKFPDVLWVLRLRGTAQGLALAPLLMLPSTISTVSASRLLVFEAQSPSPPVPLFTLHRLPRGRRCKTQGRVGRYSFLVRLFHSLLHAGLSRRSEIPRMHPLPCRCEVFSSKLLVLSFAGCATDFNTSFGSTFSPAAPARFTRVSPVFSRVAFFSINTTPSRASPKNTSAIAWCITKATRTWELPSDERNRSNAGAGRRRLL